MLVILNLSSFIDFKLRFFNYMSIELFIKLLTCPKNLLFEVEILYHDIIMGELKYENESGYNGIVLFCKYMVKK